MDVVFGEESLAKSLVFDRLKEKVGLPLLLQSRKKFCETLFGLGLAFRLAFRYKVPFPCVVLHELLPPPGACLPPVDLRVDFLREVIGWFSVFKIRQELQDFNRDILAWYR